MNVTYKLIKNRNGQTVVASELAKGHKKNTRLVASALLLGVLSSLSYSAVIDLNGMKYTSGELIKTGTTYTVINSDNGSIVGNGYDGRYTKVITDGSTNSVKFGNAEVKQVATGGFVQTLNFKSMWDDGYVKLYKKVGNVVIPPKNNRIQK